MTFREEAAQQLSALAALAEDLALVLSTCCSQPFVIPVLVGLIPPSGLCGYCSQHGAYMYLHVDKHRQ